MGTDKIIHKHIKQKYSNGNKMTYGLCSYMNMDPKVDLTLTLTMEVKIDTE